VEKDPQLRVLILTGAGDKAFVAGAEIHELDKRDMLFGPTETRRRQDVDNHIRLRLLDTHRFLSLYVSICWAAADTVL
jgi:enoyl-CoA hydratase/carnithine racemase